MRNPAVTREAIAGMIERGLSQSEVAKSLGVSSTCIEKARARYGIAYAGQRGPKAAVSRDEFKALWRRMTPQDVARKTDCHITSVYARARRMGLPTPTQRGAAST